MNYDDEIDLLIDTIQCNKRKLYHSCRKLFDGIVSYWLDYKCLTVKQEQALRKFAGIAMDSSKSATELHWGPRNGIKPQHRR